MPPFPFINTANSHQSNVRGIHFLETAADAAELAWDRVPAERRSGMTVNVPECGEVPGVLMSLCASTQSTLTLRRLAPRPAGDA